VDHRRWEEEMRQTQEDMAGHAERDDLQAMVSTGKRPSLLLMTAENGNHSSPSVPMGTVGPKSKSK